MTAQAVGSLVEVDIMVRPIESPKRCDTSAPAADNGDLLPGKTVNRSAHCEWCWSAREVGTRPGYESWGNDVARVWRRLEGGREGEGVDEGNVSDA